MCDALAWCSASQSSYGCEHTRNNPRSFGRRMAPDPGGHAPRPGCRRRPGAQRPRHRRRARSTVSCSLAEDATDPGAARATTPAPRPMTRTSPCSTRCLTLTLTLTRSAGREPGNQNWCREHAPGPRVGPGSGEAGGTQMLGGRRPIPALTCRPKALVPQHFTSKMSNAIEAC